MSDVEVFFSTPYAPHTFLSWLTADLQAARQRVAVASAWFTDTELAGAIVAAPAARRIVLLNRADLQRDPRGHAVLTLLQDRLRDRWVDVPLAGDRPRDSVRSLGSTDFREGVMHHNVVADVVVWVGSFNLTFQARKNYESILRVHDAFLAERFWQDAERLLQDRALWEGTTQFASTRRAVRCTQCERLFAIHPGCANGSSWMACADCATALALTPRLTAEDVARRARTRASDW